MNDKTSELDKRALQMFEEIERKRGVGKGSVGIPIGLWVVIIVALSKILAVWAAGR